MSTSGFEFAGRHIPGRVVLAPMAGVTDLAFRTLAWEYGIGLAYSEMVSAMALVYESTRTKELLAVGPTEGPFAVQIFGSEPEVCARGALLVLETLGETRPASIDINMGCPTPKIVRNGEGSALMRDIPRAAAIVAAVDEALRAVQGPSVTVKMRIGWDHDHINAVEFARAVVEAGAVALAVHGRTRDVLYSGQADWSSIRSVKEATGVTVIGNGDVTSPERAAAILAETGCDAVMIGRAALGNPWLLRRTDHYLRTGELTPGPTHAERISVCLRHLAMQVEQAGPKMGVLQMRKHCAWYLRGIPGSGPAREHLNKATTAAHIESILSDLLATQPANR